jgi:alkylated DNA nucleotide flippase Atl1
VVPAPREVDALMRKVRRGKIATINELRTELAAQHAATIGCPITTGIFAWMAAHAAAEQEAAGRKNVTPWWRTLKTGGELNPKYPGGAEEQARRLRAEGHVIIRKGKRWLVDPAQGRKVRRG